MTQPFRVGLTRDFLRADGTLSFGDIGLDLLTTAPRVQYDFLAENTRVLAADQVRDYDALLVLGPEITAATLECAPRLAIVARFGVGYDNIDVEACTQNDILLTITPDGVRRPVAVAALTFLLALSHKVVIKDRLTRSGRWGEKLEHMGMGVTGRTLGVIGLGNIGRELLSIARPLDMRHLAYDPFVTAAEALHVGVELVELNTLLRTADFVCVCCALTPETHHLLDARRISMMQPTSYLINVARGPIVDQRALTIALQERRLQGAGLDVFEKEPIDPRDPLLQLDNVILAPHGICWTDECFRGNGRSAIQSILDVAAGKGPRHVVNRPVLDRPGLQEKLRRHAEGTNA